MTVPDPAAGTPSKRSWLLIVSLAFNLLILGGVAGAVLTHGGPGGRRGPFGPADPLNLGHLIGGEQGLRGFGRTLPPDRRKALHVLIEQARQTIQPLRKVTQQARADALVILKAEPFDSQRLDKAMSDLIAAESALRRASASAFVGAMGQMTPDERARFQGWRKAHEHDLPPPPPAAPVAPPPEPK